MGAPMAFERQVGRTRHRNGAARPGTPERPSS